MKTSLITILVLVAAGGFVAFGRVNAQPVDDRMPQAQANAVRFAWVDVFVDPQGQPLAAWQFNFKASAGDVKITGLEGGEHAAFTSPPYYDTQAIQGERVIAGAFSTLAADKLPHARTRVARIMVQITGDVAPRYVVELTVAGDVEGKAIPATITFQEGSAHDRQAND